MTSTTHALLRHFAFGASSLVLAASSQAQVTSPTSVLLAQAAPQKATAITTGKSAVQQEIDNKKRWSVYWGWNRSNYSNSDIHFRGSDHDFTLKDVQATDLQSDAGIDGIVKYYLNPGAMTIPQTNLRVAYQWNQDTAIALNLDHMKYVVTQDQLAGISGQIKGVPQSGKQLIADNWLNYEHTDGLNIVSLELEKQRPVDWFGANHAKVFGLVGLGIVIPKTNATMHMVGQTRNDEFHLAGWSVGAGAGLEVDVWKDVFLRTAYKVGYVDLPDVLTSARGDKASQHFTYNELLIAVGMRF